MAVRAYVLMNLATTDLASTLKGLKSIEEVKQANAVIGPYDCIAELETGDMETLGRVVVDKIIRIDGVAKTLTCVKL